jgi:hypothetical protein
MTSLTFFRLEFRADTGNSHKENNDELLFMLLNQSSTNARDKQENNMSNKYIFV